MTRRPDAWRQGRSPRWDVRSRGVVSRRRLGSRRVARPAYEGKQHRTLVTSQSHRRGWSRRYLAHCLGIASAQTWYAHRARLTQDIGLGPSPGSAGDCSSGPDAPFAAASTAWSPEVSSFKPASFCIGAPLVSKESKQALCRRAHCSNFHTVNDRPLLFTSHFVSSADTGEVLVCEGVHSRLPWERPIFN